MINGVVITDLKKITDDRGAVMHMLRSDSEIFKTFGEIYFSSIHPGAIKAWRLHQRMTLNYAVPVGYISLVLYDDRPDSPTCGEIQEIGIGESCYKLVTVPPRVWNGFMGQCSITSLVVNCATLPHDPKEISRCDINDGAIPYVWPSN